MNILRPPDYIAVITDDAQFALDNISEIVFGHHGVEVTTSLGENELSISLAATNVPVKRVHLRWRCLQASGLRVLGDHWERGYGDLQWRCLVPEQMLPWYFVAYDGKQSWGCGVKTQANAICAWRVDPEGISLWLDVRSGGIGVELGDRTLHAATVVTCEGARDEPPFVVAQSLCRRVCDALAAGHARLRRKQLVLRLR